MRLTILHTNDIHGRQDRIAQIATHVARVRAAADHPVLYLDAGDVEESTSRISSMTKGTAMHRLLGRAGCDAATVGNACWLRYGPGVLADHARASPHPQLLANFEPVEGPVPFVLLGDVGVFGLSDPYRGVFTDTDFGFEPLDELEVARRCARDLRGRGARLVVFLSHLGLDNPPAAWDDRRIAAELQGDVDLIIGGHTHDLLPEGERIGNVLVAQAGAHGEHLGRIEIDGDRSTALVEPVTSEPDQGVLEETAVIEAEIEETLSEELGVVDEPIDAQWIAAMLRRRMNAEVGVFTDGLALRTIPPGTVDRRALWEASETGANPGVTEMTGAQLAQLVARGSDPELATETPRPLRGRPRGFLRIAGVDPERIDPERRYTVAGSDWELDPYGGYADAAWGLRVRYDFPTIIREAVEEDLARR